MAAQSGPPSQAGRFSVTSSSIVPKVLIGVSVLLFALGIYFLIPPPPAGQPTALLALVEQSAVKLDRGDCPSTAPESPATGTPKSSTPTSSTPTSEDGRVGANSPSPGAGGRAPGVSTPATTASGVVPVPGVTAQIHQVDGSRECVLYGPGLAVESGVLGEVGHQPMAISSDTLPGFELAAARLADDRVLVVGVEQSPESSTTVLAVVLLAAALAVGVAAFGASRMRAQPATTALTTDVAGTGRNGPGTQTGGGGSTRQVTRGQPAEQTRPLLPMAVRSGTSGLTVDRGTNDTIDVYAATQAGPSHVVKGQTREDSYALGGIPGGGWTFVAVADGLSSTRSSEVAAAVAATRAIDDLSREFGRIPPGPLDPQGWHQLAARVMGDVAEVLRPGSVDQKATDSGYRPRTPVGASKRETEPSTTLTMAAIAALPGGLYAVHWAAVGDCEVVVVGPDGGVTWLTDNQTKTGRVRSNAVDPLPARPERVKSGVYPAPPGAVTVLASDGCADAIRRQPEQRQFVRHLLDMRRSRPKEHVFGELVGFDLDQLYDDRTIVAVWSNTAPLPEAGYRGPA